MLCRSFLVCALLLVMHIARAAEDESLANGILLVARPELTDPNFRETVVLITQPVAGGGPLGVILNRPTEFRLSQLLPSAGAIPEQFDHIYVGGPVARNQIIYLVHTEERFDQGLPVLDNVYLAGDAQLVKDIVAAKIKAKALRAYAGYAGWAPRQLQGEISAGGWYMLPADAATIFAADTASLWRELIRRITQRSTQRAPCQGSKNSLTLSIQDFARGLCLPESLTLIASSSASSSR
jgi:putative transcriptional regulator